MSTNLMPAELAEIVAIHRDLFGGFTMTAAAAEGQQAADQAAADAAAAAATAATEAAQKAAADAAAAQKGTAWDGKVETLPAGAQDLIKQLRAENAQKRTAAKAADDDANAKIAAALKALGIDVDGQKDPVKAAEQAAQAAQAERDAEKATARNALVQLAIYKQAASQAADPLALLDSNSFLASIKDIDPADAPKIQAAIKAAVDTNPKLKATQVVGKSGPEHTGGAGGQGKPSSLEEAIAAKLAH